MPFVRSILRQGIKTLRSDGLAQFLREGVLFATKQSVSEPLFPITMPPYVAIRRGIQELAIRELLRRGFDHRLSEIDLCDHKTSDTVFLLGSGASINDISEDGWDQIDEHDSIGLNFWMTHEFVPTFYVYELSKYRADQETFYDLLSYRREEYTDVPFILKDLGRTVPLYDVDRIPESIRRSSYLAKEIRIPWVDTDYHVFRRSLRWFNDHGYFDQGGRIRCGLKKRASISFLIVLAINMGYRNIVLCGVDMNDSRYFYEEEREKYECEGVPLRDETDPERDDDDVHRTNDPDVYRPIFENVLYELNDYLLEPRGISLYTASKRSATYPTLELYDL